MNSVAYPKILALGTPGIESIFDEEVEITEKLDGSQFGFGRVNGELVVRSKGTEIQIDSIQKLFVPAVNHVLTIQDKIPDGFFFYGETLASPRHSTLAYDRVPKNHIALFGVMVSSPDMTHEMLDYDAINAWAETLEVDAIPLVHRGNANAQIVLDLMKRKSYLGGQDIEGLVVKNYKPWYFRGREIMYPVMAGKYVSEAFKEVHNKDWSKLNTGKGQLEGLKEKYKTEARWNKAIQHLEEEGKLVHDLKDIGALMIEVKKDLGTEEKEHIKQDLWKLFGDDIIRNATSGLPEFYKKKLLMSTEKPEGEAHAEEPNEATD